MADLLAEVETTLKQYEVSEITNYFRLPLRIILYKCCLNSNTTDGKLRAILIKVTIATAGNLG